MFLSDPERVLEPVIEPCRQVRTMELALAINGQTGDRRVRGRVRGALERPASLRLEGLAPFGAPLFVLVSDPPSKAVLVLPRDRQVVTHDAGGDLLERLTGLALEADDLRAVLTGCLVPDPRPVNGRTYRDGWQAFDLEGDATIFLRSVGDLMVVVAGTRPGMTVEYFDHVRGLPRRVRVYATDRAGTVTDFTATLSQVSINIELDPAVFVPPLRNDYAAMTLEQFRGTVGPLDTSSERPATPR